MDLTIDADRTSLLVDHREHDPVVEKDKLFDFVAKLGEGAEPFAEEATNCRSAFVKVPRPPPVKDRIGSVEAHYRVDVTLIRSLEGKARKLNQVGGRGLLGHPWLSIPQPDNPRALNATEPCLPDRPARLPYYCRGARRDVNAENTSPLLAALEPSALRAAMVPRRPVYGRPWDSAGDMFLCYFAVSVLDPLLLWCGGELMSAIFGFGSRWSLGVFMAAALVGAAGFITIVGRERTSLSVDVLAIGAWLLLGLVVAPILGLAPPTAAAVACYAVLLLAIRIYVLRFGRWQTPFLHTLSWPVTWSLLALFFAFSAYRLILFH
jgi:hypothetical protein